MYEQKEQGRGEDEAGVKKKKNLRGYGIKKRGRKGLKLEEGEEDGLKKMKGGR